MPHHEVYYIKEIGIMQQENEFLEKSGRFRKNPLQIMAKIQRCSIHDPQGVFFIL